MAPVFEPAMHHGFSQGIPYQHQPSYMGDQYHNTSYMGTLLPSWTVLTIDLQKQRPISHPTLDVTRPGHQVHGPVETIHQNMISPDAMNQGQRNMGFVSNVGAQTNMPQIDRRYSTSRGLSQDMGAMPQFGQPQQMAPIQSAFVPMSGGFSQEQNYGPQLIDDNAMGGQMPINFLVRRHTMPGPPMWPEDYPVFLPNINEFNGDEFNPVQVPIRRMHRDSAPAPMTLPQIPMVGMMPTNQLVPRNSISYDGPVSIANPLGPVTRAPGPMHATCPPSVSLQPPPFSYVLGVQSYPEMAMDLANLRRAMQMNTDHLKDFIDILVQRSPDETEALKQGFRSLTGTELSVPICNMLSSERQSVKYAFTGLALGPASFDVYLLDTVLSIIYHD
jgi:hypothetical protein